MAIAVNDAKFRLGSYPDGRDEVGPKVIAKLKKPNHVKNVEVALGEAIRESEIIRMFNQRFKWGPRGFALGREVFTVGEINAFLKKIKNEVGEVTVAVVPMSKIKSKPRKVTNKYKKKKKTKKSHS